MKTHLKASAGALALCLPALAFAQSAGPAASGHRTPPLSFQSAFADYKPWKDIKPANWRAVNDTVGGAAPSVGRAGHGAAPAAATSAPATRAPSIRHHGGHHSHGGAK